MIGSLLYLCASRPDSVFSVGLCARFQSNPKESHMTAVKRILRYLVDTPHHGLVGYSMQIGEVTPWIENQPRMLSSFMVIHLCVGL